MQAFAQQQSQLQKKAAKTAASGHIHNTHSVSRLQSSIGNQAMQRLMRANNTPTAVAPKELDEHRSEDIDQQVLLPQRMQAYSSCGCGSGCPTCKSTQQSQVGSGSNALASVLRSTVNRDEANGGKTNYRFDTYAITEKDLSDPDIIARLNSLSKAGLIDYRKHVKDPAVSDYITKLIDQMPALPACTTEEAKETSKQAEAARVAALPLVADAVRALGTVADINLACAFSSNFNTDVTAPEFQTRRLIVARRLTALSTKMKTAVPFTCVPADDTQCMEPRKGDTVAYVVNHQPPIKFCPSFKTFVDDMTGIQQAIVTHEYSHLVGGIDDSGGYAANGAQLGTCGVNTKFKADGDVLINTADALTGFVMHIGNKLTPAGTTPPPPPKTASTEGAPEDTRMAGDTPTPTEDGESTA